MEQSAAIMHFCRAKFLDRSQLVRMHEYSVLHSVVATSADRCCQLQLYPYNNWSCRVNISAYVNVIKHGSFFIYCAAVLNSISSSSTDAQVASCAILDKNLITKKIIFSRLYQLTCSKGVLGIEEDSHQLIWQKSCLILKKILTS